MFRSAEGGFSEFTTIYVIRNATLKAEFQVRKPKEAGQRLPTPICPPYQHWVKAVHWATYKPLDLFLVWLNSYTDSMVQSLPEHMLFCAFHMQTIM